MIEAEAKAAYDEANEQDESIIRTGLPGVDIPSAVADDRTIFAAGTRVPLLVPLQHYSVFRPEYFTDRFPAIDPQKLYGYAGSTALARVLGIEPVGMVSDAVGRMAEEGAMLVYEQSEQRDVHAALADALSTGHHKGEFMMLQDLDARGDIVLPKHYIYEISFTNQGEQAGRNVYDAYREIKDNSQIELVPELPDDEIERTYQDYVQAYERATHFSPLQEVLPWGHYNQAMSDARYWKFVVREEGVIQNLSVICPIEFLPWMNQAAIKRRYEGTMFEGAVFGAPLIYSRVGSKPGQSMKVMQLLPELLGLAGGQYMILGEAHDKSKWLAGQLSMVTAGGSIVEIAVEGPILEQSVEVLSVQ